MAMWMPPLANSRCVCFASLFEDATMVVLVLEGLSPRSSSPLMRNLVANTVSVTAFFADLSRTTWAKSSTYCLTCAGTM